MSDVNTAASALLVTFAWSTFFSPFVFNLFLSLALVSCLEIPRTWELVDYSPRGRTRSDIIEHSAAAATDSM